MGGVIRIAFMTHLLILEIHFQRKKSTVLVQHKLSKQIFNVNPPAELIKMLLCLC